MPRQNPKRKAAAPPPPEPKAKATRKPWAAVTEYRSGAAGFFASQMSDAKARNGGVLVGDEGERVSIGVPLKAFSLQYVHSSDIYPLGRMEMTIGESDSCKTAYLFEKMRWFLREPDGGAVYELNEARDPADLRTSIIGRERLTDGRFKLEGPCQSLEHWQRNVTALLHQFENTFKAKGGCGFPVIVGLDSITGTTNEGVIKTIDENGCAKLTFGQDANLLNMYAKYLFQRLYPWPISFVCTNHIKFGTDRYNNKVMRIPGGDELRYVSTYISHLSKQGKDLERLDVAGGRKIRVHLIKSMGDHRWVDVEFSWIFRADGTQVSTWNWHAATVELLANFSGERKKLLDEVIEFPLYNKNSRTTACPAAGHKKAVPFDVVGQSIMHTPKLLKALQDMFGIKRRRTFEPGVPYSEQIANALAAGETEVHNTADVAGEVPVAADGEDAGDPAEVLVEE